MAHCDDLVTVTGNGFSNGDFGSDQDGVVGSGGPLNQEEGMISIPIEVGQPGEDVAPEEPNVPAAKVEQGIYFQPPSQTQTPLQDSLPQQPQLTAGISADLQPPQLLALLPASAASPENFGALLDNLDDNQPAALRYVFSLNSLQANREFQFRATNEQSANDRSHGSPYGFNFGEDFSSDLNVGDSKKNTSNAAFQRLLEQTRRGPIFESPTSQSQTDGVDEDSVDELSLDQPLPRNSTLSECLTVGFNKVDREDSAVYADRIVESAAILILVRDLRVTRTQQDRD